MKNVRLNTFASIVATIQPQLPPSGAGFWSEGLHVQPERDWAEPREALTVSGSPHDLQMVEILHRHVNLLVDGFHSRRHGYWVLPEPKEDFKQTMQ